MKRLLLLVAVFDTASAQPLSLHRLFSDHMVLQRDLPMPVYGEGTPGSQVAIRFGSATTDATVSPDGRWKATLPAVPAGGPHELEVTMGGERLHLKNILTGDVWLASGQSNMAWKIGKWKSTNLFEAPPKPNKIRWFRKSFSLTADQAAMATTLSLARPNDLHTVYLNGEKVAEGRNKQCVLELPSNTFQAGVNQLTVRLGSCWSPPAVGGNPEEVFLRSPDGSVNLTLKDGWKCSDSMEPPLPEFLSLTDIPSCLFNSMIHPLLQSPVKGVIWYQGEQNLGNADAYAKMFPAMILDWRTHFQQPAMPFYFVQLANLGTPSDLPTNDSWPLMREAQAKALALTNTGMATAFDIGEALDIHPKNKQDVGNRLALQALAKTYGNSIECHGPVYQKHEIRNTSLVIHFNHAAGLKTADGAAPKGFAIAGDDRVFHRAKAVIDGTSVVLSSDQVPSPVAVRYAFAENPIANLHNAANLPAYPFRTDDWIQITSVP